MARFHILPADNSLKLLSKHKTAIMFKSAIDILQSMRRAVKQGLQSRVPSDILYCKEYDESWLDRATKIGVTDNV